MAAGDGLFDGFYNSYFIRRGDLFMAFHFFFERKVVKLQLLADGVQFARCRNG